MIAQRSAPCNIARDVAVAFALLASSAAAALAQAYPTKPVKIIVAFTAGGTTDIMARSSPSGCPNATGSPS